MNGSLHIKLGKEDRDLEEYFSSIDRGTKSEKAKNLMRLGLAVEGVNLLQLLIDKGILEPGQVAAAGTTQAKSVAKDKQDAFLKKMVESWE